MHRFAPPPAAGVFAKPVVPAGERVGGVLSDALSQRRSRIPVLQNDEKTIVAVGVSPMGAVDALIMQKDTGLVMWTKVQDSLVLAGQAIISQMPLRDQPRHKI